MSVTHIMILPPKIIISKTIINLIDDIKITTLKEISHEDHSDKFIYDYSILTKLTG